jgi:predicted dehydrogenase
MKEEGGQVRLGIIGLGGMGSNHLRNAAGIPGLRVTAVCDTDASKTAAAVASGAAAFTDHARLLDAGLVDAVLIATPHFQHVPVALTAFERGIHVLTEKPVAVFAEDVRRAVDAHERARARTPGLLFAAVFQQRTLPVWRKVKELLDAGALGRIIRATWIVTDWFRPQAYFGNGWRGTWKGDGGGVLMNQSPHQLDLFSWFCGLPSRVHGFAGFGKYHRIEVEDEVSAFFEYADGRIGHFITSTAEAPGTNRLEIAGEMGRLVVEGDALRFRRNAQSCLTFLRDAAEPFGKLGNEEVSVSVSEPEGSPHRAVLANFVNAIRGTEPLVAPAAEGINSVMIANAVVLSALRGAPVDLPLGGGELASLLAARETRAGSR